MIGKTIYHFKILDIWKNADEELPEKIDAQKKFSKFTELRLLIRDKLVKTLQLLE